MVADLDGCLTSSRASRSVPATRHADSQQQAGQTIDYPYAHQAAHHRRCPDDLPDARREKARDGDRYSTGLHANQRGFMAISRLPAVILAAFLGLVSVSPAALSATLIHSFQMDAGFSDGVGSGALSENGNAASSSFSAGAWNWTSSAASGAGLILDASLADQTNYSIGFRIQYGSLGGYRKILSFENFANPGASDSGLYFNNNSFDFYVNGSHAAGTSYSTNTYCDFVLTRSSANGGTVVLYVDDGAGNLVEVYNYVAGPASLPQAVGGGKYRFGFFMDDQATSSEFTMSGKVDSIRVWDGVLTSTEAQQAVSDTTPPAITFSPVNGQAGIAANSRITISFDEAVRNIDDSALNDTNVDALIALRDTDASGSPIPFDAVIDAGHQIITITPAGLLGPGQTVYVAIGATVEDLANNAIAAASAAFVVVDSVSPSVTFAPANGATSVAANDNITITFSEAVRHLDDSPLSDTSVDSLKMPSGISMPQPSRSTGPLALTQHARQMWPG
ncbi:MAG: Ig-like domain-containing protein [Burkholderiaceae bacterium]